MKSLVRAVVVLVVAGVTAAVPVGATDKGTLTLDASHPKVTWSGSFTDPIGAGVAPPLSQTCTDTTCDTVHLAIDFPAGSFPNPGDGVLVSIKWTTDYDQWNLFVDDPSGLPVAQGLNVDSNAQSVLVPQPANGIYTVHAVPVYTTFAPGDLDYQGVAEAYLDQPSRATAGAELRPQLWTAPPSEFTISGVPPIPSNPTGWRWTKPSDIANSCYLDETIDFGSTRCLRFSNDIRNVGPGPLLLRFRYDTNFVTACQMQQEIQVAGGGTPVDVDAGECVFHTQHAHFHYNNFARYELFAVGAGGAPAATHAVVSKKVGFCTVDVDDWSFGGPAAQQRPRTYVFPTCNIPNNVPTDNPAVWEYMGISAGWGDIYTWDLPAQYIDISAVPDGVYEVVSRANPDGAIVEAATGLETGITCVRIAGTTVTVLQEYPAQSNTAPLPTCTTG
jgi:hypothetical protein